MLLSFGNWLFDQPVFAAEATLSLGKNDTILFYDNSTAERLLEAGALEA